MLPQLVKSLDVHFKTSRTPGTWTTHTFSLQVCSEAQRVYWIWSCVSWPQSIVLLRGRVSAVPAAAESADLCLGSCSNFHLSPRQYRSDSGWYVWDLGWWANYVKKLKQKAFSAQTASIWGRNEFLQKTISTESLQRVCCLWMIHESECCCKLEK